MPLTIENYRLMCQCHAVALAGRSADAFTRAFACGNPRVAQPRPSVYRQGGEYEIDTATA
jgi:hypothetical protein